MGLFDLSKELFVRRMLRVDDGGTTPQAFRVLTDGDRFRLEARFTFWGVSAWVPAKLFKQRACPIPDLFTTLDSSLVALRALKQEKARLDARVPWEEVPEASLTFEKAPAPPKSE